MTGITKIILYAVILILIGAYGYQWKTFSNMQTDLMAGSIDFLPYFRPVTEFVNEHRRWPDEGEVYMPTHRLGGVVKDAELQVEGRILLTLSAWSVFGGNATVTIAPLIDHHRSHPKLQTISLQFQCLSAEPIEITDLVCRGIGRVSQAQLQAANDDGFERLQQKQALVLAEAESHKKAVKAAETAETQCDVIWRQAQSEVIPCIEAGDQDIGAQFRVRSNKTLNGPRLNGDAILRSPELLTQYNVQCEENWRSLVGTYRADFPQCFQ